MYTCPPNFLYKSFNSLVISTLTSSTAEHQSTGDGFDLIDIQDQFVVVNKHPGISFHSEAGAGLVVRVQQQLGDESLFPVHRLDRVTSGLLLLARSAQAAEQLNCLFRERQIDKYYLALSDRKPRKKQGLVSGDMTRARRGSWKLLASKKNPARTRFFSYGLDQGLRLFVLKPLTGRTHQLRVMMKSLGAPILGDERYYSGEAKLAVDRTYLHAYVLRFDYQGVSWRYQAEPVAGRLFSDQRVRRQLEQLGPVDQLAWP